MLGVSFAEILHALRMLGVFFVLIMAAFKLGGGDVLVDPSTIEVGSADWARYVREHFSNLNV
jgi:hypothetical protein